MLFHFGNENQSIQARRTSVSLQEFRGKKEGKKEGRKAEKEREGKRERTREEKMAYLSLSNRSAKKAREEERRGRADKGVFVGRR